MATQQQARWKSHGIESPMCKWLAKRGCQSSKALKVCRYQFTLKKEVDRAGYSSWKLFLWRLPDTSAVTLRPTNAGTATLPIVSPQTTQKTLSFCRPWAWAETVYLCVQCQRHTISRRRKARSSSSKFFLSTAPSIKIYVPPRCTWRRCKNMPSPCNRSILDAHDIGCTSTCY